MISISLCMIVKNEENVLARCLDSYKGVYDELIIVDTGSTDQTKQIAARYTDKIYDYKWNHDFAAARNYAFSLATGDYIFSADADEYIDTTNKTELLTMKQVLLPEIEIVQMYYVNFSETKQDHDNLQTVYNSKREYRPKLFKRLRTFHWISPIHETVRLDPVVYDSNIEIIHKPESSHKNRDLEIFHDLLSHDIRLEDYCLIMLCKELFISGNDADFLLFENVFGQQLKNKYQDAFCQENIDCVLARIYRLNGDVNQFFALCMQFTGASSSAEPSHTGYTLCSEICMELGLYFKNVGLYEDAINWFQSAASAHSSIDIRTSGYLPLTQLSECYAILAEQAKGIQNSKSADQYFSLSYQYQKQAESWSLPDEN